MNTSTPELHILTRSDLADLPITPSEAISIVEDSYIALAERVSRNPAKLMMPIPRAERDAVSYSMLGYDGCLEHVGFKTSYRRGSTHRENYYTAITLYDDTTGSPFAMLDCHRVGATRTPATTALLARSCAAPHARSALMVGTGAQGVLTLPYVLTALPYLEDVSLFGTHPEGIRACVEAVAAEFGDRRVNVVDDVETAARKADIVIAASGRATHPPIQLGWLPPGGLLISVSSKGVSEGTLADADYAVATSAAQAEVTGRRLAGADGTFRVDAELPDILVDRAHGRHGDTDRVFAFNSGMVVTDISVASALATRAISGGRGHRVALWS